MHAGAMHAHAGLLLLCQRATATVPREAPRRPSVRCPLHTVALHLLVSRPCPAASRGLASRQRHTCPLPEGRAACPPSLPRTLCLSQRFHGVAAAARAEEAWVELGAGAAPGRRVPHCPSAINQLQQQATVATGSSSNWQQQQQRAAARVTSCMHAGVHLRDAVRARCGARLPAAARHAGSSR